MSIDERLLDEIRYSKGFEDFSKEPTEYLQFLQWVKDFICITKQLNRMPDRWYMQLFYIYLVGLFDVILNKSSIHASNDSYAIHVKQCVTDMLTILTDDEYLFITYKRHCAAHPLQNKYDLFDSLGNKKDKTKCLKIRGVEKIYSVEDMIRAIDRNLAIYDNNEMLFDAELLRKLTPFILKLQNGIYKRFLEIAKSLDLAYSSPQIFATLNQIMLA